MSLRMDVLHVTHRYPPRAGGVERHVEALATGQRRRGHHVRVVSADRERRLPPSPGDVPVDRHRGFAPGGAYHLAPGVYATVDSYDGVVDIVHVHNYHALPFVFGALATSRSTLVATPHYHGESASGLRDRLLSLYHPIGRRALARADAVVAVGEWERGLLERDFAVEPTVVRNGLDAERFVGATPERRDRPYLLTVGRLVPYKRVELAIRALTALPSYDLLVAGRGPDSERLARLAADLGVATRVEFLGHVADERLPGLYAGATAHLALSTLEAYGLTVGEALAAGTPCVVPGTGALSEWASRADCVATTPDAASVATAVDEAASLDAPAAPLQTWSDCVEGVLAVYDRARTS